MRDFHMPGRSAVFATQGMCATSHPLAAQTAIETLKSGGNAVDAAIAGAVLLGICEPQMTGIGGDLFALVATTPDAEVVAFNGSGRAPRNFDAGALRDEGHLSVPRDSVHAVTIPGAVDGFCALSERFGKLGLDQTLAPSIDYAERGVPVAPRVAFDWALAADALRSSPSQAAQRCFLPGGSVPMPGTLFQAKAQARALRAIADNGRAGFYEGAVAEDMVTSLKALGGTHDLQDFADTRGSWGAPISTTYGQVELLEHPPNGQGATALLMANMAQHFDWPSMDPWGAERAHIEAEITKLAYDARNRFLADPDHVARLEHMLAPETARSLAGLIDPNRALAFGTPLAEQVHKDTIYITVVDGHGMCVSLIYSIFDSFGSCLASSEFEILFQNRGAGFNLTPGHPNEAGPGKRPMHTIIPGMLRENGRVTMPFGVMGGAYQPNGHLRFLSNMVDYALDPQSAIDAPRSFADGNVLKLEKGYSASCAQDLADRGHKIVAPDTPIGGAQAIKLHANGVLEGASDPRKDGCALGY